MESGQVLTCSSGWGPQQRKAPSLLSRKLLPCSWCPKDPHHIPQSQAFPLEGACWAWNEKNLNYKQTFQRAPSSPKPSTPATGRLPGRGGAAREGQSRLGLPAWSGRVGAAGAGLGCKEGGRKAGRKEQREGRKDGFADEAV